MNYLRLQGPLFICKSSFTLSRLELEHSNPSHHLKSTILTWTLVALSHGCSVMVVPDVSNKFQSLSPRITPHLFTNTGIIKRVEKFMFGCGLVNNMDYGVYKNNKIAGIMGLGWGTHSFVNQIRESKGRFSYCLQVVNFFAKARPFSNDLVQGTKASSMLMIKVKGVGAYYLELQGISINRKRLNISKDVFALKYDGSNGLKGGCITDLGMPYSRIVAPAYQKLKEGLQTYFSKDKNLKRTKGDLGLDLCYEQGKPEEFKNLPDITLHFQGTKSGLVTRPQGFFEVAKRFSSTKISEYFCLAVISSKHGSLIGAQQQTSQRVIYDTQKKKLVFHSEDCSKNS